MTASQAASISSTAIFFDRGFTSTSNSTNRFVFWVLRPDTRLCKIESTGSEVIGLLEASNVLRGWRRAKDGFPNVCNRVAL